MAKYYFVGPLLPSLSFETAPEITFTELDVLFKDNFSNHDYEKVISLRQLYDILNIRALWMEEELDPRGVMTSIELEEALINGVGLQDYVYDFIDRYPKKEDLIQHFPFLLARFFKDSEKLRDPFLRNYLAFERELRLVMTAFRAKKLGRDLSVELQYENPEEEIIGQLLALQDAPTYEPPEDFRDLKLIFDSHGDNPLELEKALDEYRVEKIESLVDLADVFSIERMLAYLSQFLIIDKWFEMDREKGIGIVESLIRH